ncbi:kxDL motif-containing protein CG10681 isoform X2 [Condylostylus longicornis]|uniref:kxDL motif-containing protein CG10681 isoform X2 n=1 Tax=Condylostylus longicornis TaxID=2530218 RepID=UPI00244DF001|nr:kxDL motif-containing protein CG10681 isoform X2 [Condylostylus longicornis]
MTSEMSSSMQSRQIGEESEFSIFQNYTAAEVFIQGLAGIVNQSDVESMIRAQKHMLQRFEKTNEMIVNCNALSVNRLKVASEDFKKHVKLLNDMKKDLDYIFRKIRNIRTKISQQYPEAYAEALPQRNSFAEEAEDDDDVLSVVENTLTTIASKPSLNSKTLETDQTTIEYVQMDENSDNGKPIENELIKRVCSIENPNVNDSSDCTSEDTG